MKQNNTYTSAITGKTYTLPAFYCKSRNTEKVCNSETATLLYTYLVDNSYMNTRRHTFQRVSVYQRQRGGCFTIIHNIGNSYYNPCYDDAPEKITEHQRAADNFPAAWRKLFTMRYPLPDNRNDYRREARARAISRRFNADHAAILAYYKTRATEKAIARHARKVNRAAILATEKAIKATAAACKAGTLPKQITLEMPEVKPAAVEEPKPVTVTAVDVKPVEVAPIVEAVTTSTNADQIAGKGWRVLFDTENQRTRVVFDSKPARNVIEAVKEAGFFWSPKMQSWNKHLTNKARRAATVLAEKLATLAA